MARTHGKQISKAPRISLAKCEELLRGHNTGHEHIMAKALQCNENLAFPGIAVKSSKEGRLLQDTTQIALKIWR